MKVAIAVTLIAVVVLVLAEVAGIGPLKAIAKTTASTGFVAVAFLAGATSSPFGWALLVALSLSWLGDVALLGKQDFAFRIGLTLFLLGHLGFDAAFLLGGITIVGALVGLGAVVPLAWRVHRWLSGHVAGSLWIAVRAYLVVIASMVALAVATVWRGGSPLFLLAATLFFVSDLLVAREKFVHASTINPMVGLPLYYGAQLFFASSPVWGR